VDGDVGVSDSVLALAAVVEASEEA
jgi:hypothetical protein